MFNGVGYFDQEWLRRAREIVKGKGETRREVRAAYKDCQANF